MLPARCTSTLRARSKHRSTGARITVNSSSLTILRSVAILSSTMKRIVSLLAIALWSSLGASAEVRLPKILSSHMVLQRDRPMHFWGWADPGEKVNVTLDGQSGGAVADKLGKWSLYLPAHAAGGPFTVSVKGTNDLSIDDVIIGDVWFAS